MQQLMMYIHQHTRRIKTLAVTFMHTLPTCVTKSEISTQTHLSSIQSCCQGSQQTFFSTSFFFFLNERVTCFCLTPPKPPPHREQSGPFIQALSQSAARGKRGWSVTNRSPVLHHWALGAASEKEEKIRMKSEPSPLALSLNFSSMSQRQSDSLDALRKRSMTSPSLVCLEGGWLNESSAANRSIPAFTVSPHS